MDLKHIKELKVAEGMNLELAALSEEFEAKFGRNRTEKDDSGKDVGEWLDITSGYPLNRYRSMVTEYAWLAFVYGRTGMDPQALREIERGLLNADANEGTPYKDPVEEGTFPGPPQEKSSE
jgi:hypothetical protein